MALKRNKIGVTITQIRNKIGEHEKQPIRNQN